MGQGDFIHNLMDLLCTELAKPAKDISRNNMLGFLE